MSPPSRSVFLLVAALAACSPQGPGDAPVGGPTLSDPSREEVEVLDKRYAPQAEAAAVTGALSVSETYRMEGGGETVLVLTGENGLVVQARLVDSIAPTAQVTGQTLANLMALPEDARPSLYQVTAETNGRLCGETATTGHLVVYETTGSPPEELTVLVTAAGPPGDAAASLCQVLRYTRTGG